jgi:hypothetical protein
MQYQWFTADLEQHFARQPNGRVTGRDNCDDIIYGFVTVLLHGILGYIVAAGKARLVKRELGSERAIR